MGHHLSHHARHSFYAVGSHALYEGCQNFYVPILPLYVRVLDASVPLFVAGLVVGIHRLGLAVASPFVGSWCDRIGYR